MKPEKLHTKIFLDGGDPSETEAIKQELGFLDGQTTNPSLVAKNPDIQKKCILEKNCTEVDIYNAYQAIVTDVANILPQGSVSVEVYADANTTPDAMLTQAREMNTWIPNAHIKFPITRAGLIAAEKAVAEGMRVNMTLCFSQAQAAAVHAATRLATMPGQVFVSPFIGRLDDNGKNGMDLIANIIQMYSEVQSHVQVLAASVRTLEHMMASLYLGADSITAPAKVIKAWCDAGRPVPSDDFQYNTNDLGTIPYTVCDLTNDWETFDIQHALTDAGVEKFASDWNTLIS